jgi:plastocyanin
MRFQPAELSVVPGDSVVWVNKDLVPHSATSDRAGFDSKIIRANGSWRYTVPARKGTYSYTCTFHPTMAGRLRVK